MADNELMRRAGTPPATAMAIKSEIDKLRAHTGQLEILIANHQAQFRQTHDRDRGEAVMADLLRLTADLMSAREAVIRLEGELRALRAMRLSRPWWWRMLTNDTG